MKLTKAAFAAAASLSLLALGACTAEETDAPADMTTQEKGTETVAALIGSSGDHAVLSRELGEAGLSAMLDSQASYTVFAPNDAVFNGIEGSDELLNNPEQNAIVAAILREHMVPGALTPEAIREAIAANNGKVTVRSFGEGDLQFSLDGDVIVVSGANGSTARMNAGALVGNNGVVIPLDGLLASAPSAEGQPS